MRWLLHDLDPELAPADRGLRNEGVLRPLAMKLARREQTAPVQCAAAAIGIVGRDSCTVARGMPRTPPSQTILGKLSRSPSAGNPTALPTAA